MSNAIYKKDLHDVALAVAQGSKAYTDKKAEEVLWQVGEYAISTSDDNTTAYRKTVPANATRCKIKRIYGNSVKYSPSTASDSTTAYQKTIPSYSPSIDRASASMNILGGMSYKVNQLIQISELPTSRTENDVVITNNNNGSLTLNGTATDRVICYIQDNITNKLVVGHKYLIFCQSYSGGERASDIGGWNTIPSGTDAVIRTANSVDVNFWCDVKINEQVNVTITPQIFDLTAMNIDDTSVDTAIAGLLARGINPYEPNAYDSGSIRDTAITNVKSVGVNVFNPSDCYYTSNGNVYTTNGSTYNETPTFTRGNVNNSTSGFFGYVRIDISNKNYIAIQGFPAVYGVKNMVFTDENYNIIASNNYQNVAVDISSYHAKYLLYAIQSPRTANYSQTQFEYNSSHTSYKPYFTASLPIPAQVQALDGYGWGINSTCYNYIDFNAKKFKKVVGRVDLGSINWSKTTANRFISFGLLSSIKTSANNEKANILCVKFTTETANNVYGNVAENIIGVNDGGELLIYVNATYYDNTSESEFKTAMSGVYLYYELATPVETDISQYLDGNEIEIEPNGTLSLESTYSAYVPSNISYNGVIKHALATAVKYESFNIWDEETEEGYYGTNGFVSNSSYLGCKNLVYLNPNTTYYVKAPNNIDIYAYVYDINGQNGVSISINANSTFTMPSGCYYLGFAVSKSQYGATYNNDICINISGTLNGTYKPHKATVTRALPYQASDGWGIGSVRNVRDFTISKRGTNIGNKDLGEPVWGFDGSYFSSNIVDNIKLPSSTSDAFNGLCEIYDTIGISPLSPATDMRIAVSASKTLYVRNSNFNNSTIFKSAMNGVPLFYELDDEHKTESDITAIDNILVVEEGDTITFVNEEGLPVPSDITYRIEVAN